MTATRRSRAKAAQESGTDVIPASEAKAIAELDEAKRHIDIALANEDVEALLDWADRAAAVAIYIKRRDEAREIADNAGEIKVRAEAALGKLDLAARPTAGRPPKAKGDKDEGEGDEDNSSATEELEETPSPLASFQTARRSAFRTLGKLESKELDAVVKALREDDNEGGVTTSRAVRVAREYIPVEHRGANGSTAAGKPSKEHASNSSLTTWTTCGHLTPRCQLSPGSPRKWSTSALTVSVPGSPSDSTRHLSGSRS